jgi:hypothetical protein
VSATYDPGLASDLFWVRFLIGDKDVERVTLQDEEILAVLGEEANKYLAASRCGRLILARGRGGISSKSVDGLSISYDASPEGAYGKYLDDLHQRGVALLYGKPKLFRMLS